MATFSSSEKPLPLSYAERAKRASAAPPIVNSSAQALASHPKTRAAPVNGTAQSAEGGLAAKNTLPAPAVAASQPTSPSLLPSSASAADDAQTLSQAPKSSTKTPTNVWAARREQMARAAVQGQPEHTAPKGQTEKTSSRTPLNGIINTSSPEDIAKSRPALDDSNIAQVPDQVRSPPRLDDPDSWPAVSNPGPSNALSAAPPPVTNENTTGTTTHKKGEKTKWVSIPPTQIFDEPKSQASSRAHSQHRRNHPHPKPRSRQHSRTRPHANTGVNNSGTRQFQGDGASIQSRTDSASHSRATSVQSSPRHQNRGRRLPDDAKAGPSAEIKTQTINEVPSLPPTNEVQPAAYAEGSNYPAQLSSGPQSQVHTPFTSHSPIYFPPPAPPNTAVNPYSIGALPPGSTYAMPFPPLPVPSPGHGDNPVQQQPSFSGYPAYPMHPFPSGQGPYPYLYATGHFPYYAPHAMNPIYDQQTHSQSQAHSSQQSPIIVPTSPKLLPVADATQLPPPEQNAAPSGQRENEKAPIIVSPGVGSSTERSDVVFGSFGRGEAVKSPSPVSSPVSMNDPPNRRSSTAFVIGFDHAPTIRVKRSGAQKDGVEEIVDAVKVIDLTDQQTTYEFGSTSKTDLAEEARKEEEESHDTQIIQPQPHVLHYPPPGALQAGGYYGPPIPMPGMGVPMSSHSPQGPLHPLPHHIPSLGPLAPPGFVSPLALGTPNPSYSGPLSAGSGDEWEVRDYGYGFGALSGSGFMPERIREEQREHHRDNYRDQRNDNNNGYGGGRGRRGGGSGYGNYYEGGRGYRDHRRGGRGGPNGAGRGFQRGNFNGGRSGHAGAMSRQQPVLSVATGPFHPQQAGMHNAHGQQSALLMPQLSPDVPSGSYYVPGAGPGPQFPIASPYGQFNPGFQPQQMPTPSTASAQTTSQPPMPMPITVLTFPLDPIRHCLLGQVEYYFSLQNLASDLFLRNKMDSKGWIPINLIASFNRVKQLTTDAQMVKEVLGLSSLVEVRDDHVRLANDAWKNIVLPNAARSVFEGDEPAEIQQPIEQSVVLDETENVTVEEEEEDDVEFVLVREEGAVPNVKSS